MVIIMMMKKTTVLLGVILLNGCGSLSQKPIVEGDTESKFTVLSALSRSDSAESFCFDFNLTLPQAEDFFSRGEEINASIMHDQYDWLACYVEGRLNNMALSANNCTYVIQAGGTATIECDADQTYIWACNNCEDLLRD